LAKPGKREEISIVGSLPGRGGTVGVAIEQQKIEQKRNGGADQDTASWGPPRREKKEEKLLSSGDAFDEKEEGLILPKERRRRKRGRHRGEDGFQAGQPCDIKRKKRIEQLWGSRIEKYSRSGGLKCRGRTPMGGGIAEKKKERPTERDVKEQSLIVRLITPFG